MSNERFGKIISREESIHNLPKGKPTSTGENGESPVKEATPATLDARFEARHPKFKMTDVILPESVRQEIRTLRSRIKNYDLIYREWGFENIDRKGVNVAVSFYGPPGTGKTMCAEALASELGQGILEVNYAEIESKYVGETPKNIVAAFAAAKRSNAILFFDEADSILGRRLTNVTQSADQAVNNSRSVMLKQLDAFEGIIIFATNLARNFDGAFVRRILQHIYVSPPDEGCRLLLWKKMISPKVPGFELLDFGELARNSDGLSGGLIKNAALLSLSELAECPHAERKLSVRSITQAIACVRRSQQEVGTEHGTSRIISSITEQVSEIAKPAQSLPTCSFQ